MGGCTSTPMLPLPSGDEKCVFTIKHKSGMMASGYDVFGAQGNQKWMAINHASLSSVGYGEPLDKPFTFQLVHDKDTTVVSCTITGSASRAPLPPGRIAHSLTHSRAPRSAAASLSQGYDISPWSKNDVALGWGVIKPGQKMPSKGKDLLRKFAHSAM